MSRRPEHVLGYVPCSSSVIPSLPLKMVHLLPGVQGRRIEEADVKHLSPARDEHLNVFGKYSFPVQEELNRKMLRPLRQAGEDA
jgi:hypothetical protein